jgi:hypothetical protein
LSTIKAYLLELFCFILSLSVFVFCFLFFFSSEGTAFLQSRLLIYMSRIVTGTK